MVVEYFLVLVCTFDYSIGCCVVLRVVSKAPVPKIRPKPTKVLAKIRGLVAFDGQVGLDSADYLCRIVQR